MIIAVLTDSNSGITQKEAPELGVSVLPMPFYINDRLYYEDIDLTQEGFYEMLKQGGSIKTSMPVVGDVIDRFESLLADHDQVIYIPMSSGLSSSCETAKMLAEDYEDRVFVVDNKRISVTQRLSVMNALRLAEEGFDGASIKRILEADAKNSTIYIMVDTLEYLKKGGRLTPAVAAIGTLLRIKPVLQIQGEKLDTFGKARTVKQAKMMMIDAIRNDMTERFGDPAGEQCIISMAHTQSDEEIAAFRDDVLEIWPNREILINPLSLSISCHIGPGAIAVTATRDLFSHLDDYR